MPQVDTTAITSIYENTVLAVKAHIESGDAGSVEEVTFKFLNDGEDLDEKTISMTEGDDSSGATLLTHRVKAPAVPAGKDRCFLDYYYSYKIKSATGGGETLQKSASNRIQVLPRTAQLKVTDKDGKAFHGFQFIVEQNGERSEVQKTFANDTANAKGETVPAGSCEFNLGLFHGFRILPSPPYEIVEETVASGRKREIKGALGFRAVFVAPLEGSNRQYVNYEVKSQGQTGIGDEVVVDIGIHPEDKGYVPDDGRAEVHFRVSYGPGADTQWPKSARDDANHPTKATKATEADSAVTIEEKQAGREYQGKVVLAGGTGRIKLSLGKAGGDSCRLQISGSAKFLANRTIPPDATLEFENWRKVHYELMVPDLMQDRVLEQAEGEENADWILQREYRERLVGLGRQMFIEFVHAGTQVFDTVKCADQGTLAPRRFLGLPGKPDEPVYILSGRNWREPPEGLPWFGGQPGKTLHIQICDALLKWRKDTDDEQAGTTDFSGTLTEAEGFVDMADKFEGLFMPFSGYDGREGIAGVRWTADISKDDAVCKYTPELELDEDRPTAGISQELPVILDPEELPRPPAAIVFKRPPYPALELADKTTTAGEDDKDDAKLTLRETVLGKDLTLTFKAAAEAGDVDAAVTPDHQGKLDKFFKDLFKDGKDQLRGSEHANKFTFEVQGSSGALGRSARIASVESEVRHAYVRSLDHEQHVYKADLSEAQIAQIQAFVDELLADRDLLSEVDAKVKVRVECDKDTGHGEDDCFKAVKDKFKELFDAAKTEFPYHPGLDADGEPRTGVLPLRDITLASTTQEWHFRLPPADAGGEPAPGAFIGAEKTRDSCPVKIEFAVQPHEASIGEAEKRWVAWAYDAPSGADRLVRLILRGFKAIKDEAGLDHGHGTDGLPGDCLEDSDTLCEACVKYARSRDLSAI